MDVKVFEIDIQAHGADDFGGVVEQKSDEEPKWIASFDEREESIGIDLGEDEKEQPDGEGCFDGAFNLFFHRSL